MKGLEETIRAARSIEDLFPVLERVAQEIESAGTSERSAGTLQQLARSLTDIRLAMNEFVHREVWVREIGNAPASEAARAARHLELGGRYEEVRGRLEDAMRRIRLMPGGNDGTNDGLQPAGRAKAE